jgi:hypothetical protein
MGENKNGSKEACTLDCGHTVTHRLNVRIGET